MENLRFKNGSFHILQLTDMQDTHVTSPDTVRLTAEIIKRGKPQLIVLTGDQLKGYGTYFSIGNNRENAEKALRKLLEPIAQSGIPFTALFGNHDIFGDADRDFQWSVYKSYPNFVGENYDVDLIPILSENEDKAAFCVYTFDSHGKNKDGSYTPITAEQVAKYRAYRDGLEREVGESVHALAFQHIPPIEIYSCLTETIRGARGALQGARDFSDRYFALPDYAKTDESFMGENAATPDTAGEQLAAFREKGEVLGLFFGHDHNNSFVVRQDGIDLGYTQGCGYNTYGPGNRRGGRMFIINEASPQLYTTYTVTAKDIGFKPVRPVKAFFYTHSPSSVAQGVKLLKKAGATVGAVAAAGIIIRKITKK